MKHFTFTLGAISVGAVGVGGLVYWLATGDSISLKDDLRFIMPRSLEWTFLLMVAGFAVNFRGIRELLPPRRFVPLVVFVVALVTVSFLPPRTHRIYFDEDIYQNVAQNILWEGRSQMCNEGMIQAGLFTCEAWEYNKEPNAFPFLLPTVFRVSGVDEAAAHRLNHWVFALGAIAVYWIAGVLFEKTSVALGAALVYILTPQSLLWGATVAVEPGATALAFASQFRPESGLVLAVAAIAMLLLAPGLLRRRVAYSCALLLFLLPTPHFAHRRAVRHEKWGSTEAKFSTKHAKQNWKPSARYYVEGRDFPAFFTLAALLGLFYPRRKRQVAVSFVWFALLFGIFIPFYAGSYRYGADVRFAALSAAARDSRRCRIASIGMVSDWLARQFGRSRWLRVVPYGLAVYAFTHYLPLVKAVGMEGWQARADHDAARAMVEQLPEDSILLTHNPGMIQVMGQSAAQASLVSHQPARVDHFFDRFPGGVYFHYNFWCNVEDEVQYQFCADVLGRYQTQVLMEKSAGFYRYVLHRLLPRSEPPPPALPAPPG